MPKPGNMRSSLRNKYGPKEQEFSVLMEVLQSVLSLVVTLGILVTIHEYGHFWVARKCGVKVLRFSVGFGQALFTWRDKQGTEFAIAMLPLGGYVKMLDEREGPVADDQKPFAFTQKTVRQRIAIVSAGPLANFLFAGFAYWLMFLSGFNVLIPLIGSVDPESAAANAGLTSGHEIVAIDGRDTPGWRSVHMELVNRIGDSGTIEVAAKAAQSHTTEVFSVPVTAWQTSSINPDLVADLGIHPYRPKIPAVMGAVEPDRPGMQGGLKEGDRVVSVNGQAIDDWFEFRTIIEASAEKLLQVDVSRTLPGGEEIRLMLSLKPELYTDEEGTQVGRLGVRPEPFEYPPELIREVSYGPIAALGHALDQTWADCAMTLKAIKKMLLGVIALDNLSGPITIAQIASKSISSGLEEFLRFLAFLSVSLGILNLLPIPVLDGGHLLYYAVEGLRGKPLSEKWQMVGLKIGISFILLLMSIALYNDVMRL